MSKLVSVIVAIYNVAPYLKDCIESIISQTYSNLEIILVDDGSTDDCVRIVQEYEEIDNRVVVIHKVNGGLSDARNAGIEVSTGEYLTFIDGDDYICEDYIEKLISTIEQQDADISCCGYKCFTNIEIQKKEENINTICLNSKEAIVKMLRRDGIEHQAWAKLYKSYLFKNINSRLIDIRDIYIKKEIYYPFIDGKFRYPKGIINEDLALTYYVFSSCSKIAIIEQKLYFYRKNDNSIMRRKLKKEDLSVIDLLEILTKSLTRIYNSHEIENAIYDYKCGAYTKLYKRMVSRADKIFPEQDVIRIYFVQNRGKIMKSSVSLPTKIRAITASYSKMAFKLLCKVENLLGANS